MTKTSLPYHLEATFYSPDVKNLPGVLILTQLLLVIMLVFLQIWLVNMVALIGLFCLHSVSTPWITCFLRMAAFQVWVPWCSLYPFIGAV